HFGSVHAVLAQLSRGSGRTLVNALSYHDLPPLLPQAPGRGAADALAGSGDHTHLVPQPLGPSSPWLQLCHDALLPHARLTVACVSGTWCAKKISRRSRADASTASKTSTVALPQRPSANGRWPLTTAS